MKKQKKDNFVEIHGVGIKIATALNHLDIWTFKELAAWRPKELASALIESGKLRAKITEKDTAEWIKEAAKLDVDSNQADPPDEWPQHAGFSLFIDYKVGAGKERWRWRARINHHESDEDVELLDEDMSGWVDWIIQQAALPAGLLQKTVVSPPASPAAEPEKAAVPDLEILDVAITPQLVNGLLVATVTFELRGQDAMRLAESQTPYRLISYLFDQNGRQVRFVESPFMQLESERLIYEVPQLLPLPPNGEYEVKTAVSLHPSAKMTASFTGPQLEVALPR